MTKKDEMNVSRRAFIQRASALSVAGAAAPWAINLAAMAEASAQTATDYKAIVCVFLNGGNDQSNTVVPYDSASHSLYQSLRPNFAHKRWALDATRLTPAAAPTDRHAAAREYALSPKLTPLVPLFHSGNLGILLNVGTLVAPITKAQYLDPMKPVPVPPKLFSHNDQASVWQSGFAEGANPGWGGRMGDSFQAANNASVFTCINVASNAVYLSGKTAVQYQMSTGGPVNLNGLRSLYGSATASAVLRKLVTDPQTHYMEKEYSIISKRSVEATDVLTAALAAGPAVRDFPAGNSLAAQLRMVARIISVAPQLGVKRQVFFVQLNGFDNHDGMAANHPLLMGLLGEAMAAFHGATVDLGVASQVTSFTASDFGRTLSGNDNGSDHGWGSMQFVMGGAVKGARYYGTPPLIADNGPDDIGRGRLLPTTSVDQLAGTLGTWMGIPDAALAVILPNLGNFKVRNLGFV